MPSGTPIDWSKYDHIIIKYLPSMTIAGWGRKYLPHVSTKAIGARAKKLGVKPGRRRLTQEHKNNISQSVKKELSNYQKEYIIINANKLSRGDISKKLGISLYLVNQCFNDLGIKIDKDFERSIHAQKSRMHIDKATYYAKLKWEDNAFRERMSGLISERSKELWSDERYRSKVLKGIKSAYDETDLKERLSAIGKHSYNTNDKVKSILHAPRKFKNSKLNDRVASVLDGYKIAYDREYELANYKFDFKIGTILLEVHGDYWHNLPKNRKNDRAKSTIIRKFFPHYDLKYLWESEFYSVRGTSRLLEVLGLKEPDPTYIDLSELDFESVNSDIGLEKFMNSYHYLGWTKRGSINYRMKYEDQSVIVASFGYPVRQNTASGKVLELIRLCRNPFFYNKNMASNFLSKCIKDIKSLGIYDNIVSFSDDRLHCGSVYKASNWKLVGKTKSDYEYLSGDNIPMHKKTLYNRAKAAGITEREYAELNNYRKTSIGTKTKFIYRLN